MTTKLTLTIEKEVISSVKKYAQKKGKSLSNLVENYLKSISSKEPDINTLSPKVTKLMGIIKLPEDFNYKDQLGDLLFKKVWTENYIFRHKCNNWFPGGRLPFSINAAEIFNASLTGQVKIYVSAVSYNNIYYILRQSLSHNGTIKLLEELSEMTEIIDVTKSIILKKQLGL